MTKRIKPLLAFLQTFTARGHRYHYFRRPGSARLRLPGLPGSEEFMAAYMTALTASTPPQGGSYGAGNYGMCGRAFSPALPLHLAERAHLRHGRRAGRVRARDRAPRQSRGGGEGLERGRGGGRSRRRSPSATRRKATRTMPPRGCWDDGILLPSETRDVLGAGVCGVPAGAGGGDAVRGVQDVAGSSNSSSSHERLHSLLACRNAALGDRVWELCRSSLTPWLFPLVCFAFENFVVRSPKLCSLSERCHTSRMARVPSVHGVEDDPDGAGPLGFSGELAASGFWRGSLRRPRVTSSAGRGGPRPRSSNDDVITRPASTSDRSISTS